MPGRSSHHHDEIPAIGGPRVLHQAQHDLCAHVTSRFVPEGRHTPREGQVIVDSFRYVGHPKSALGALGNFGSSERGVVSSDGYQVFDSQLPQSLESSLKVLRLAGRIGPGSAQNGAAWK